MPPEQLNEECAICGEDGGEGGWLLLLERGRIETSDLKGGCLCLFKLAVTAECVGAAAEAERGSERG